MAFNQPGPEARKRIAERRKVERAATHANLIDRLLAKAVAEDETGGFWSELLQEALENS